VKTPNEIFLNEHLTIGRAALILAMTPSREDEETIKRAVEAFGGYKCAITEVSGRVPDFEEKVTQAVIGAALNCNVIEKVHQQVHALLHATMEASDGMSLAAPMSANLVVKIGIVSNKMWIAVAMFGQIAYHAMATHERAGLGIMHINRTHI